MGGIDFTWLITIAFFGSIGHCVGMCGGIVIAYSGNKIDDKDTKLKQTISHLAYNFGRVTTYTSLGAIFGAIGGVLSFDNIAIASLTILAGVFMILAGLSLLGKFKFLSNIEHSFFKTTWYQNIFRSAIGSKSIESFYLLGLLNGLLPCGLVYFFAVTAASTGSAFVGAFVMFIFGLSTIPSLFTLGFVAGVFKKMAIRNIMMSLSAIVVIMYGFYTIYRGYAFIKNPNKSLLNCCSVENNDSNSDSSKVDDKKGFKSYNINEFKKRM